MAVVRRILDVTCVFNCKPYSAMYLLFLSTTIKAPWGGGGRGVQLHFCTCTFWQKSGGHVHKCTIFFVNF